MPQKYSIDATKLRLLTGDPITSVAQELKKLGVASNWRCVITMGDSPAIDLHSPDGKQQVVIVGVTPEQARAFFVVWYVTKEGVAEVT